MQGAGHVAGVAVEGIGIHPVREDESALLLVDGARAGQSVQNPLSCEGIGVLLLGVSEPKTESVVEIALVGQVDALVEFGSDQAARLSDRHGPDAAVAQDVHERACPIRERQWGVVPVGGADVLAVPVDVGACDDARDRDAHPEREVEGAVSDLVLFRDRDDILVHRDLNERVAFRGVDDRVTRGRDRVFLDHFHAAAHLVEHGLPADELLESSDVLGGETVREEVVGARVDYPHHFAVADDAVGRSRRLIEAGGEDSQSAWAEAMAVLAIHECPQPQPRQVGEVHLALVCAQQVLERGDAHCIDHEQKCGRHVAKPPKKS